MKVSVSGKQMQIGESLKEHVDRRVTHSIEKYSDSVTSAEVSFTKDPHKFYSAHIMVNESAGHIFYKADGKSDDVYSAFDEALLKLDKQLRRHKDKVKHHHKEKTSEYLFDHQIDLKGTYYVVDNNKSKKNTDPITIAEKSTNIPLLTVSDAINDLCANKDSPCLLFRNAKHGKFNIVYKRSDGNIGWVDPEDY